MHFSNPVPVMGLVEVIRGMETSNETYQTVYELAECLGKKPMEAQDYPGFVSNRLLLPMINEAIYCMMEGVARPEDVDMVMKLGMNHPMGPLALADLIGLDTCLHIMEVLHKGMGNDKYRPCPCSDATWPPDGCVTRVEKVFMSTTRFCATKCSSRTIILNAPR